MTCKGIIATAYKDVKTSVEIENEILNLRTNLPYLHKY